MTAISGWALVIAALQCAAFVLFAFDKAQARSGGRRVRERTLLIAALFGGVGAWAACALLRHKTRKQPFLGWMSAAVIAHLIGLAGAVRLLV